MENSGFKVEHSEKSYGGVQPEFQNDDIKPPVIITEFKQELNPSVFTESGIASLSQSTFKISVSDSGEIDSKDNSFSHIYQNNGATKEFSPSECQHHDLPKKLKEFKEELHTFVSTKSNIDSLSQSIFKLTESNAIQIGSKKNRLSQILLSKSKEVREKSLYKELMYHSNSGHVSSCLKYPVKVEEDSKRKELSFLISSSTSEPPIMIQSKINDLVSGNVDLENDIDDETIQINEYFSKKLVGNRFNSINEEDSCSGKDAPMKDKEKVDLEEDQILGIASGKGMQKVMVKRINSDVTSDISDISQLRDEIRLHSREKSFEHYDEYKGMHFINQSSDLQMQENIQTRKKLFKCKECGKCLSRSSLQGHMRIHTGDKRFKCKECGKCFTQYSNHQKHMRMHTGEKPFKCEECGKCFNCSNHLQRHMIIHTGEKPFKCKECGKCFKHSRNHNRHMRIHTGEKPFKCGECGKYFNCISRLQRHIGIHTGEKPFKCKECGKFFTYCENLLRHMRIHTGEKAFKCKECGKCFTYSESLLRHMRIHTGEKPFKCEECGRCFTQINGLQSHMRTHIEEKAFKCKECEKCFNCLSYLQRHMGIHTGMKPFKCAECEKCYTQSSGLQKHMRMHRGEKPFKCEECKKCFPQRSCLQSHMRTHTGEKPFKCEECGKCFTNRSNLKRHIRLHTGVKSPM